MNASNKEDVSTDKLMEHAESLLLRARKLIAKPDRKRKHTVTDPINVETATDQHRLEGQENTPPIKPSRKIKCQLCNRKFFTLAELKSHHTTDHGIVKCKSCSKCFNSKEALEQHMQQHTVEQWICDSCGKGFQYKSHMLQHQTVHMNESRHHCPKEGCDKKFKNVDDYNRHLKSHDSGNWYSCSHCTYHNKDKRNRDSHMRTHTPKGNKERYECEHCHKQLRFSTQVRRHRESGCELK